MGEPDKLVASDISGNRYQENKNAAHVILKLVMIDTLSRLYRTKMLLSCVLLTVIGVLLLILAHYLDASHSLHWLSNFPWSEFGGILVGAGVLSVWLDHFFAQTQAQLDEQRLRRLLHDQAPVMRDAVLDAFAANHADLERVATPEMLDGIIGNSLALRLHDQEFASEVYADIRDQAISSSERWHDLKLAIDLTPAQAGGTKPYFSATVRYEYTTTPQHAQRRFACVSDREEYLDLAAERGDTSVWLIRPDNGLDAGSTDTFELLRFTVNGEARPIRRASRRNGQIYTASIGTDTVAKQEPVTISYTYRTLTAQAGHYLFFEIEQPTKGLSLDLDYRDCDIAAISVLDLVPSVRPILVERPPAPLDQDGVRVEVDGWIFPRSGVAFVWSLGNELPQRPGLIPPAHAKR